MSSPFEDGLKIKRDHDRFKSLFSGASIRFYKLWFDEVELEAAYVKSDKQVQGVQTNIQHIENKGETKVLVLSLKKKDLFQNKLAFKYKTRIGQYQCAFH